MTTIDLLKFVKAQLIHMEEHLQAIDQASSNGAETVHKYPLHSNTGALFLIDLAIQEDKQATEINQELLTRLYTLKNAVGNLIWDGLVPEGHDAHFFYKEAQETIKRVKPEGFTIEEDDKAMNIKRQ